MHMGRAPVPCFQSLDVSNKDHIRSQARMLPSNALNFYSRVRAGTGGGHPSHVEPSSIHLALHELESPFSCCAKVPASDKAIRFSFPSIQSLHDPTH